MTELAISDQRTAVSTYTAADVRRAVDNLRIPARLMRLAIEEAEAAARVLRQAIHDCPVEAAERTKLERLLGRVQHYLNMMTMAEVEIPDLAEATHITNDFGALMRTRVHGENVRAESAKLAETAA